MSLEEFLRLVSIIIQNSDMSRNVKDFFFLIGGEINKSILHFVIETDTPL